MRCGDRPWRRRVALGLSGATPQPSAPAVGRMDGGGQGLVCGHPKQMWSHGRGGAALGSGVLIPLGTTAAPTETGAVPATEARIPKRLGHVCGPLS